MALSTDDKLEIHELAHRYNHAVDSGDGPAYAGTFTEDGVMQAGDIKFEGAEALEQFANGFGKSPNSPRHVISNIIVEGDGDHATLKAYIQMFTTENGQTQLAVIGKYDDELIKKDGKWRFVRREFTADR